MRATFSLLLVAFGTLTHSTAWAQAAAADKCAPRYAMWVDNSAVIFPRELASPCLAPEVLKAADALGMVRYAPPTVKSVIAAQWIVEGTLAPPGSTAAPYKLTSARLDVSYVVPAMRLRFEGTDGAGKPAKGIYVASGKSAWNETQPGIGASAVDAGALDQRLPLIWLTPHGAIWTAIDADPNQVKVTREGGKTVIAAPFEGLQVTTTLGTDGRPEHVRVQSKQRTYEARYSGYFDPDPYLVVTPRQIEWTLNGHPLANLSVTAFRANPYVVFPVPLNIKQGAVK